MSIAASPSIWDDAVLAATIFAVAPAAAGGVVVRAQPGPVRDGWLALLRAGLPPTGPVRQVPVRIADDRLLGGLDLAASLRAGKPMAERGILAACDCGVAVLAMAERIEAGIAARIAAVLDCGEVEVCRDGITERQAARLGVVALDEGLGADERVSVALADRMAFRVDLTCVTENAARPVTIDPSRIAAARARLPLVRSDERLLEALCGVALAFGIASARAPLLASRTARAHAALDGRGLVTEADAIVATRLVLAPRATQIPASPPAEQGSETDAPPDSEGQPAAERGRLLEATPAIDNLAESLVETARAVLPAGVLDALASPALAKSGVDGARAGASRPSQRHGRPAGSRRGDPRGGARLHLIETLKAAAPWQVMRRQARSPGGGERIEVRRADFRIKRFKQRAASTTIFLVDASGSTATQRLAEAKGAVELLLAECYVRRDQVALLAFRGTTADILLPPTRSLTRAKRCLAGLPGGGGTPLATAIAAGMQMAELVRRAGQSPALVMLTDGRANITRDGRNERPRAEAEALAAARLLRAAAVTAVLIDTSQHPRPVARELAQAMGARYLPLPRADAEALSHAVRAATGPKMRAGEPQAGLRRQHKLGGGSA